MDIKNTPYHSLLLVEDDQRLANLIKEYMENHGFQVNIENRGDTATVAILEQKPDLVILDLMLPGIDGLEVCRRIRPHYAGIILMLTAQDEDIDQIVGLELGADDYVVKPVEPRVLLARIKSLLRRIQTKNTLAEKIVSTLATGTPAKTEIISGALYISLNRRYVSMDNKEIKVTTGEFDLLWHLASHAGSILSRDNLYKHLCGIEYDGTDRSMDIRISRLRKLLQDDHEEPQRIKTIRSKGYLFVVDEEQE
ncbi:MAG: response regulator [Cellvibrionaceae bacterium]